jgi:hypothetical protein
MNNSGENLPGNYAQNYLFHGQINEGEIDRATRLD